MLETVMFRNYCRLAKWQGKACFDVSALHFQQKLNKKLNATELDNFFFSKFSSDKLCGTLNFLLLAFCDF